MKQIITISFLLFSYFCYSQSAAPTHRMEPAEKQLMPDYLRQIQNNSVNGITTPPVSPVRASAEWEEIDALMITWTSYTSILKEIVRAAQLETKVLIVCTDSTLSLIHISEPTRPY